MIDLSVKIAGIVFNNPVLVASGTFGYAEEFAPFFDVNRLGGIITKTVTMEPRPGNRPPRIAETHAGMLNSIGLPNVGVEKFIELKMPFLASLSTLIIINVAGKTTDDFRRVVSRLDAIDGIAAYELNYSCPNVKEGGLTFSSDPHIAEKTTREIRKATSRPLIAKLTPNVTSISSIGLAVQNGGADAVSAVNTFVGMAVDIQTRRPKLSTVTGGLSGPAIKPLALAKVHELVRALSIPVIAIGGIANTQDALEFLITGATAVQTGTANFINPRSAIEIIDGLTLYCGERHIENINHIIKTIHI
jgi:dihydroorotate dehydrogenase (NAD+) catalytic subunit